MILFAIPQLIVIEFAPRELRIWDALGLAIFIAAFCGEALADRQLRRFKADPDNRGRVCDAGLWRYSRHPNYFFEWMHWWAYCVMAIGVPWGWITLVGPAAMLLFLLKLTGVPPTERRLLHSKGDAYRDYQRRTSVFIPLPPHSRSV